VHFVTGVEAISMATMALTISISCWALLNVTICSDDDGFGLLGGALGCGCGNEGPTWVISVGAMVNVGVIRCF
jgi:hypothetical protein